MAHDWGEVVTR